MLTHNKPIIAIPLGDAAGIGPEIVAKVAAKGFLEEYAQPIIVGDESILKQGMKIANLNFEYNVAKSMEEAVKMGGITLLNTNPLDASKVEMGVVSAINGKQEADVLVDCVEYCKAALIEGICFAPLNKAAMKAGGYKFESEHELFAKCYGNNQPHGEINVMNGLYTSRVTSHIPLKDVSQNLTVENVLIAIDLIYSTLKKSGIDDPKVAIAALNPHGGDNGTCGREEIDVLAPAIEIAKEKGMNIVGPFPADTLFIKAFNGEFNAAVTMFHDQGQIAIKVKGFDVGVTVAGGQPHPITTPAHGTAYDIAGKGICKTTAFEEAYKLCVKMALTQRNNK